MHQGRLLIEDAVVRAAAERISADVLKKLRAAILLQEACIDEPVRFLISDREFHTAIYRAGGNPLLADMAADLYSYQLEHRRRAVAEPGSIRVSIDDHKAILAGLERGDADAASAAFAIHEKRIFETTQQRLSAAPD